MKSLLCRKHLLQANYVLVVDIKTKTLKISTYVNGSALLILHTMIEILTASINLKNEAIRLLTASTVEIP